jgi:hypothetical protein
MTLRPGIPLRREKGQPEGSAVTGKTRKPGATNPDLVPGNEAGEIRKGFLVDIRLGFSDLRICTYRGPKSRASSRKVFHRRPK